MSSAVSGFGTTLTRDGNTIAELTKIDGIEVELDTKEVTNHQSADSYREFIGVLFSGGEINIEGNFIGSDTDGQVALYDDMHDKTIQDFVMTFPDASVFTFTALVTKFKVEAPLEEAIAFSATLKISGKPTFGVSLAPALTNLAVTTGTLVPSFGGTTYEYVVNIATDQSTCTVTPTCATADSIEVDGNVVASGEASSAVTLGAAGSITTITVVTKKAGYSDRIYTLHLTRAAA
jgi:predicted secreted protein